MNAMARCEMCGAELADAAQRFCGGDTCDRVLQRAAWGVPAVWIRRGLAIAVTLFASLALTGAAHGQVPTAVDHAACNEEAPRAIKAGSASPTTGDQARAASARVSVPARSASETPTTSVVESSDPQIHGMLRAGAGNAAYQAAYRSCMRRKGF
jgi:hypothetical protein